MGKFQDYFNAWEAAFMYLRKSFETGIKSSYLEFYKSELIKFFGEELYTLEKNSKGVYLWNHKEKTFLVMPSKLFPETGFDKYTHLLGDFNNISYVRVRNLSDEEIIMLRLKFT